MWFYIMDSRRIAEEIQSTATSSPPIDEILAELERVKSFDIAEDELVQGFAEAFDNRAQAASTGVELSMDCCRYE